MRLSAINRVSVVRTALFGFLIVVCTALVETVSVCTALVVCTAFLHYFRDLLNLGYHYFPIRTRGATIV